jgi:uncharacterized membrane protein (DUF106 family)
MVDLTVIPYSTLSILLISFLLSLATSVTNRLFTNREQMKAWSQELAAWRADSQKATRTGDKKLMAKVKKQQQHILQIQSKMTWKQTRTSFLWFIPLMLLWYLVLIPLFGNVGAVAFMPGIGGEWSLPMVWWYLLCSFLSSTLLNRVLGLALGGD